MHLEDMGKELDKMLTEFQHENYEMRQAAVQAGAEVMKTALEQTAPRDTGELAKSFSIKDKYPDHRYVGSTRTVNGKGADGRYRENIPLINILEYRVGGTPFVRNTYDAKEQQIYEAIKNKLNNGGK
jgi:hypothetical protein